MLKFKQFLNEGMYDDLFRIARKRQFMVSRQDAEKLGVPKQIIDAHESDMDAFEKIAKYYQKNTKSDLGNRLSTNVADRRYGSVYDRVLYGGKEKRDRLEDIHNLRKGKESVSYLDYVFSLSSNNLSSFVKLPPEIANKIKKMIIKEKPAMGDNHWYERTIHTINNVKGITGR